MSTLPAATPTNNPKLNGDKSSENLVNEKRNRDRPRKNLTSEGQADNQGPVSPANDSLEVGKRNLRAMVIKKEGFPTRIYHTRIYLNSIVLVDRSSVHNYSLEI